MRGAHREALTAVGKRQSGRSSLTRGSESSAGQGVLNVSPESSGDVGKVGSELTDKPVGAQGVG